MFSNSNNKKPSGQTKGDLAANSSETLVLNGEPNTHFTVLLKPRLDQFYCLDDIVRIYDDTEKVDLLYSTCGRFQQKPVYSCSNKIIVEILNGAKRTDWLLDFISSSGHSFEKFNSLGRSRPQQETFPVFPIFLQLDSWISL